MGNKASGSKQWAIKLVAQNNGQEQFGTFSFGFNAMLALV
jgi:hypothetical protein